MVASIVIDKKLSAAVQSVQSIDFVREEVNKDSQELISGLIVFFFSDFFFYKTYFKLESERLVQNVISRQCQCVLCEGLTSSRTEHPRC